jgi:hypothetical protein
LMLPRAECGSGDDGASIHKSRPSWREER